ncbi:MAG: PQQ-binding-like beta-propeller repeat protein [Myxococcota bacterium]
MLSLRLVVPLALLILGACTLGACKKDPPPAVEQSPEAKHKRQCERFATEAAGQAVLAGQLLVTALDDDPAGAEADASRGQVRAEARGLRKELLDKCMTWPEDVMRCLSPLGMLRDGCEERVIAAMDGATPLPKEIPTGPKPSWTFSFESEPRVLELADDGTVLAVAGVESDGLVGLRDGKVVWRKAGDHARWLLPVPGSPATWVAAEENRVVAFDPSSGKERWTASLPALPEDDGGGMPAVRTAAVSGQGLLVLDGEGRFFLVNPERCASPPGTEGCVEAQGQLKREYLDSDVQLHVDAAGMRYVWEDDELRVFSAQMQRLMTIGAHDGLGQVILDDPRLVLLIDGDVVVLDPTRCHSGTPVAPSGWPQPGALVLSESECEGCVDPPEGCRTWRSFVRDSTYDRPALLDDGTVVVHAEEYTQAIADGTVRWKVGLGGQGPLATDGRRVFGVTGGLHEGEPPALLELDPTTGMPRWQSPLSVEDGASIYGDDVRLVQGKGWLVASAQQTLTALKLPPG